MKRKYMVIGWFMLLLMAAVYTGCDYESPQEIYPRDSAPDPVITGVSPDSAYNGVMEITLTGENFSAETDQNIVFFGSSEAEVLTSTEETVVVRRPIGATGALTIKACTQNSFGTTSYGPYSLESGVSLISTENFPIIMCLAVGGDGSVYAHCQDDVVYKYSENGGWEEFGDLAYVTTKMHVAKDGSVYLMRYNYKRIYRIGPEGGEAERLTNPYIRSRVSYFEFFEQDKAYAAGDGSGIYLVNFTDETAEEVGDWGMFNITALRVYDKYLYVAGYKYDEDENLSECGVWKSEIQSEGSLGQEIIDVFSYGTYKGLVSEENTITDLTFSEQGVLFISTNDLNNPVITVGPGGDIDKLYAGILTQPVSGMYWDTGNYLYVNNSDTDNGILNRVVMGEHGASYVNR